MLERVKDFRYEEIKNWKPIVSLRESYSSENWRQSFGLYALMFLAVVFAFGFLSGWFQKTDNKQTADKSASAKTALVKDGSDPTTELKKLSDFPQAAPIPSTDTNTNTHQPVSYQQPSPSYGQRIAVCDVSKILAQDVSFYQKEWEADLSRDLFAFQQAMINQVDKLTPGEVSIQTRIFEQEKVVGKLLVEKKCLEMLDSLMEKELRPIMMQIAQQQGFDVVLPSSDVLVHSSAIDITDAVDRQWAFERQRRAALQNQRNYR